MMIPSFHKVFADYNATFWGKRKVIGTKRAGFAPITG
jgi:hypothetical protein